MAGRFRIFRRSRPRSLEGGAAEPDIAVVPVQRWALGLMIVASAGALLATSDPDDARAQYSFEKSSAGPASTLSANKPQARYLVRVHVTGLGPEDTDTTESALATVHGTIVASANATVDSSSPFVAASFGSSAQSGDAISALSSFQLSRPLRFTGNCQTPAEGTPCEAESTLEFDIERPSALSAEGSVSVTWTVDFASRAFKPSSGGSGVAIELPWTLEIVEQ